MVDRPDDTRSGTVIDETRAPVANRGATTVSIMLATFMQGVDTTIANVALPHMQGSFSASQDQIAWVVTSYIVAAAIMTPLTGWLAGRFGIKYVFFVSVAVPPRAAGLPGAAVAITAFSCAPFLCLVSLRQPQRALKPHKPHSGKRDLS